MKNNQKIMLSTFYIVDRPYAINVDSVREVTRPMIMSRVPLAPKYIFGLINLRGQIATAISLRELFKIEQKNEKDQMNVVCSFKESFFSMLVDKIGDVIEVSRSQITPVPETIPDHIRKFMMGVHKMPSSILSIIDIDKIYQAIKIER